MTRHNSPSPLLNSPLLIIILPVIALVLLFFTLPPFLSFKTRPTNSVKASWDLLNIFLVLFAILCGVFARKNDDESTLNQDEADNNTRHHQFSEHLHPRRKIYNHTPATESRSRLKRSSSSYPDLKQESFWETGDDRSRFFDDFEISKYRSLLMRSSTETEYNNDILHDHHCRQLSISEEFNNVKEIPVDTFVLRPTPPSPLPSPPAPPPPPPPPRPPATTNRNQERRIYETVSRKKKEERQGGKDYGFVEIKTPPPAPPPPPPPPPRPPPPVAEADPPMQKSWKSGSKKSNATKEIKMVLASLYNQRKRKKKQKTKSLYVDGQYSPPQPKCSTRPPPSPPPPPPPPPPPSKFYDFFRKATKSKRIHSFSAPPPPPPPPPSISTPKRTSKRKTYQIPRTSPPPAPPTPPPQPSRRRNSSATGRPPLPTRANNFYEENVNSGGQSPIIPMPPPPPPPFRVPAFRFVVNGDFVKIRSAHSSRCSSPELEPFEKASTQKVNTMEGRDGKGGGPAFCPSPDVNIKADTFIAKLRDEWRLEKINSMKEKETWANSLAQ